MSDLSYIALSVAVLAGAMVWLFLSRRNASRGAGPRGGVTASALTLTRHYQRFPQIRLALSAVERQYLLASAPVHVTQKALRERRGVARGFLKGIREDFSNLERLGRVVAVLSPVVSREQETERLILSMKFRALYTLVWLRLSSGDLPVQQLEILTGLVGRLTLRMEQAVAEINALSAGQLTGKVGA